MNLLKIAARVAAKSIGGGPSEDDTHTSQQEQVGYVKKTPGKGYCVKSEHNPDWSGGCYPTKGEANKRLEQVEAAKHAKASSRTASAVKITKFKWDPGDERSYGNFSIEAETSLGKLVGSGMIDSGGGTEDEEWSLNGKPLPSDIDFPDLGIPHYYAGSKAMTRFQKVKDTELAETLGEWVDTLSADMGGKTEE